MARTGRRSGESGQSARRFQDVRFPGRKSRRGGNPAIVRIAILFIAGVLLRAPQGRASTLACFRTMEEYALGSNVYLPERFMLGTSARPPRSFRVDVTSVRLHGIPGLKAAAAGLRLEGEAYGCSSHAIALSSPVGSEMSLSLEASAVFRDRIQSAIAFQYHTARLDGFETAYRVSAAVKLCARVSDFLTVGYTIDNCVVAGEKPRGVSASAFLYGHPVAVAGIYAFCALDRAGNRSTGAGVVMHAHAAVRLVVGYDDGARALKGAVTVHAGRFRLSVGSGIHPVLGVTKGVSLGGDV